MRASVTTAQNVAKMVLLVVGTYKKVRVASTRVEIFCCILRVETIFLLDK
jgi:hypothetical protein